MNHLHILYYQQFTLKKWMYLILFMSIWEPKKGMMIQHILHEQHVLVLREDFLTAGAGLTGVNFAISETGGVVVCTNEGNADMGASLPKITHCFYGYGKNHSTIERFECIYKTFSHEVQLVKPSHHILHIFTNQLRVERCTSLL